MPRSIVQDVSGKRANVGVLKDQDSLWHIEPIVRAEDNRTGHPTIAESQDVQVESRVPAALERIVVKLSLPWVLEQSELDDLGDDVEAEQAGDLRRFLASTLDESVRAIAVDGDSLRLLELKPLARPIKIGAQLGADVDESETPDDLCRLDGVLDDGQSFLTLAAFPVGRHDLQADKQHVLSAGVIQYLRRGCTAATAKDVFVRG
jgi:hypothetical protein